jgi:hypothetical protein
VNEDNNEFETVGERPYSDGVDHGVKENPDPTFAEVLDDTQSEYREALDRLSDTEEDAPKKIFPLNKKRMVMNLSEDMDPGSGVPFITTHEDGTISNALFMDREDWEAFSRPNVITVAIVPRDILN